MHNAHSKKMSCFYLAVSCYTMFSKILTFLKIILSLELHVVKRLTSLLLRKRESWHAWIKSEKDKMPKKEKKGGGDNEAVYHQGCFLFNILSQETKKQK